MRIPIRYVALVGVLSLGACKDDLVVTNPNQPDTKRVLATAADVESLLGNYYKRWHTAMYGALGNVWGMAAVQAFEDYSSLSNNCLGQRVGIPRAANDNSVGNGCAGEQARIYQIEEEVVRVASTILNTLNQPGFTLGSAAQDARAKAFAEFLRGLSLGYLALVHDSAAIVTPDTPSEDPGELDGYPAVMAAALDALQKSIDHANSITPMLPPARAGSRFRRRGFRRPPRSRRRSSFAWFAAIARASARRWLGRRPSARR
jgi:starch-binding outer membrane protein, SusD/RagB family